MIRLSPRPRTAGARAPRAHAARPLRRRAADPRRALAFAIACAAGLAAGFAAGPHAAPWLWRAIDGPGRAVEAIAVVGHERVDAEAIARRTGVERGAPIDAIDFAAAAAAVAAEPWVREARVRRAPDGTLLVAVEERAAAALLEDAARGAWLALESDGRPIAPVEPDAWPALPRLRSLAPVEPGVPNADAVRALALVGELAAHGLPAAEWIALPLRDAPAAAAAPDARAASAHGDADIAPAEAGFRAKLADGGAEVVLGDAPAAEQLARLATLLAERPDVARAAARIDLRFRDRAVLLPRDDVAAPAAPATDDARAASADAREPVWGGAPASDEVGARGRERAWMRALALRGAPWTRRDRTSVGGDEEWLARTI